MPGGGVAVALEVDRCEAKRPLGEASRATVIMSSSTPARGVRGELPSDLDGQGAQHQGEQHHQLDGATAEPGIAVPQRPGEARWTHRLEIAHVDRESGHRLEHRLDQNALHVREASGRSGG